MPEESQSVLTRTHLSRLRKVWRSAGWPARDSIELDLLVHRFLDRHVDAFGRECLSLSETGLRALGEHTVENRRRMDRHESLCRQFAEWLVSQGRLAFLGTRFRAKIQSEWRIARPDVFSIRRTSHEKGLAPIAYEIKVERSDFLGDLSRPGKRAAYIQVATQMYYVLREGIAGIEEVPPECGVIIGSDAEFRILRTAPAMEVAWNHRHWMSLLTAQRVSSAQESLQWELDDANERLAEAHAGTAPADPQLSAP